LRRAVTPRQLVQVCLELLLAGGRDLLEPDVRRLLLELGATDVVGWLAQVL
jgi:hypothetical protein